MGEPAHVKVNKSRISYDWLTCIELRLIYLHTDSGIESVGTPNELALLAVISQQFKHGTSKPCWTWVLHLKLWCGVQAQRPWFHYPWRWLSLSWLQAQTLVFLEFRITNKGRRPWPMSTTLASPCSNTPKPQHVFKFFIHDTSKASSVAAKDISLSKHI